MSFSNILTNWKTSVPGLILLVLAVLQMAGVSIPGIGHVDFGTALTGFFTGLVGLAAKDSTVTGGSTPNT